MVMESEYMQVKPVGLEEQTAEYEEELEDRFPAGYEEEPSNKLLGQVMDMQKDLGNDSAKVAVDGESQGQ